jgi:nicotinamide phosphoribosyltransferase
MTILSKLYGTRRTDLYKVGHWLQYPKSTTKIYSYEEARGGLYDYMVFFGLQIILEAYLKGQFIDQEEIEAADKWFESKFGTNKYFNRKGWEYILDEHKGRLPIEIKAVPEGTIVPNRNVLMTVENTDPEVPWITNYVEPLCLHTYYGSDVATLGRELKKNIASYAALAGETVSLFHLNDFGYRAAPMDEAAEIGGAAHLINFDGTDNAVGILTAEEFYDAKNVGGSVLAAEHSTITSHGKINESYAYAQIINACPDHMTVSLVCDSYDAINAVSNIFGHELRELIMKRKGKVVIRPDSGNPVEMAIKTLELLWANFGGVTNARGYKVLDPHVGVIYGDYISPAMIDKIMHVVVIDKKFAPSNIIFGMGGELLAKKSRDDLGLSFKCSCAKVGGEWRDVYKSPVTDMFKASKHGKLRLVRNKDGGLETLPKYSGEQDELVTVFCNGEIKKRWTFDEIRERAAIPQ